MTAKYSINAKKNGHGQRASSIWEPLNSALRRVNPRKKVSQAQGKTSQGKIRFIYPEKGIDESLHEGTYWLTLEAKLKLKLTTEKQTFTYTDDPDEEGSNLFYFRNDCPIDHQNGLYIRINHPVTQEEE